MILLMAIAWMTSEDWVLNSSVVEKFCKLKHAWLVNLQAGVNIWIEREKIVTLKPITKRALELRNQIMVITYRIFTLSKSMVCNSFWALPKFLERWWWQLWRVICNGHLFFSRLQFRTDCLNFIAATSVPQVWQHLLEVLHLWEIDLWNIHHQSQLVPSLLLLLLLLIKVHCC
jgi:hypothetical protein